MRQEPEVSEATTPEQGVPRAIVRRHNYRIEFGRYALEVDPSAGGRIVEFSLDGRSVVLSRSESLNAYGSSFWPSPQSDWQWPPPPELDRAEWNVSLDAGRLLLESDTNAKLGLSAKQSLWADLARELVVIDHALTNRGSAPRKVAPWQNTRVKPGGLTFFPSDSPSLPPSTLELKPTNGVIWSKKAFADGREGWLAHVDGDLLFLKVFPDVPRAAQAPSEAEIELYVQHDGSFVEVEQQGAYEELAPGASSSWQVRWLVRKLPSEIEVKSGSAALLAHVRSLVARAGLQAR